MISRIESDGARLEAGVVDAEREVTRTKLRLRESLQLASETGSRLVTQVRKQATPALVLGVVVSVLAVAGATIIAVRSGPARGWRASQQPSPARKLARQAGIWLLRVAALRVVGAVAARTRDSRRPASPASS